MGDRILSSSPFEASTASTSVLAGSIAWMDTLQGWLDIGAAAVAIVAGLLAIYSHIRRNYRKDKK